MIWKQNGGWMTTGFIRRMADEGDFRFYIDRGYDNLKLVRIVKEKPYDGVVLYQSGFRQTKEQLDHLEQSIVDDIDNFLMENFL